ncbi:hypothetical protein MNBD_GAMMA12-3410 [hydrothermal vent metagenome]|uniref:Uncharacterized protein n=1 Tax=hydrothermal vent metagenome TaxID=652676 RepID=A0A3B0YWM8_9ZZZZ
MVDKLVSAKDALGDIPNASEIAELLQYYPTYDLGHRNSLLHGYFAGKTLPELVDMKLKAKNIDKADCSARSRGGHAHWVVSKLDKTVVRFKYLRLRLKDGMTRRKANQQILAEYSYNGDAKDGGQSNIRKMTRSPVLDK